MILYKCEKCLKEFNKKSNYLMHIEHRKNPCKNEIIYNEGNSLKFNFVPEFKKNEYLNNNLITLIDNTKKILLNQMTNEINPKIIEPYTLNLEINKNSCKYCNKIFNLIELLY